MLNGARLPAHSLLYLNFKLFFLPAYKYSSSRSASHTADSVTVSTPHCILCNSVNCLQGEPEVGQGTFGDKTKFGE